MSVVTTYTASGASNSTVPVHTDYARRSGCGEILCFVAAIMLFVWREDGEDSARGVSWEARLSATCETRPNPARVRGAMAPARSNGR